MIELISLVIMFIFIDLYYKWSLCVFDTTIFGIIVYFLSWLIIGLLWKKLY